MQVRVAVICRSGRQWHAGQGGSSMQVREAAGQGGSSMQVREAVTGRLGRM